MNADEPTVLGLSANNPIGANLFAYCNNNPVNNVDPSGFWGLPLWAKIAIGIVGIAASVALTVATGGTALPALIASLKFVSGSIAVSMAIEGLIGYLTGGISGLKDGLLEGAVNGFMWGGIGAAVNAALKAIKLYKTGKVISSACFVAGTIVSGKDGDIPIETISVGDLVWSENPETGQKDLKRVVQTFIHEVDHIVNVDVNGEKVQTTEEHPFWVEGKGWIGASHLQKGDYVRLKNGETRIVRDVSIERLDASIKVYNFEVEEYHTYYVGESAILVHNTCGMYNIRTLQETVIKGYKVSLDVERGGSGLINIHLKINQIKYFWDGNKFLSSAGKAIPNSLKNNDKIMKALKKALEAVAKGRI